MTALRATPVVRTALQLRISTTGFVGGRSERISKIMDIRREVQLHYGLSDEEIQSSSRRPMIVHAQRMTVYLSKWLIDKASYPEIASCLRGNSHSSAVAQHSCARDMIEHGHKTIGDVTFGEAAKVIEQKLGGRLA